MTISPDYLDDRHNSLAAALVAFHADAPKIALDSTNPHFKSKFASLSGIMEAVRGPLHAQGLAIVQQPTALDSGMPGLRTTLLHGPSGQRMSDVMPLAVDKPGPQALGSALTYARRYSVLAILGLVGDEDDDAQGAEKPAKKAAEFKAPTVGGGNATKAQQQQLAELIAATKITEEQVAAATEGKATSELTIMEANELIARLTTYAENLKAKAA